MVSHPTWYWKHQQLHQSIYIFLILNSFHHSKSALVCIHRTSWTTNHRTMQHILLVNLPTLLLSMTPWITTLQNCIQLLHLHPHPQHYREKHLRFRNADPRHINIQSQLLRNFIYQTPSLKFQSALFDCFTHTEISPKSPPHTKHLPPTFKFFSGTEPPKPRVAFTGGPAASLVDVQPDRTPFIHLCP